MFPKDETIKRYSYPLTDGAPGAVHGGSRLGFMALAAAIAFFILLFIPVSAHNDPMLPKGQPKEPPKDHQEASGNHFAKVIRIASPQLECTYYFRLAQLFYTEAFARLGYDIEMHSMPSERVLRECNAGRMDLDPGRIKFDDALMTRYPNLIRVDEAVAKITHCAFAMDPDLRIKDWQDLVSANLVIGYDRGTKLSELRLKQHRAAPELVRPTTDLRQGLRMLQRGRINVLVAVQHAMKSILSEAEFRDTRIFNAGILDETPIYPYLHKKHGALAPRLAGVIRDMKADGSLQRFNEEAEKASCN